MTRRALPYAPTLAPVGVFVPRRAGHRERTADTDQQRRQFLQKLLEGCRKARETLGTIPVLDAAPLLADIDTLERRLEAELAALRRPTPRSGAGALDPS